MRRTLVLATILAAAWSASAIADGGGPAPGLDYSNGVLDPGTSLRYLAVSDGRTTVLESIRVPSGTIYNVHYLKGNYGIPLVSYSGQTGGLSRDDSTLVLATWPGQSTTRFLSVNPVDLRVRARVLLHGAFAFDALSPDGKLMYVIQYLGQGQAVNQPYAVRAFDWSTRKLLPGSIVDRREPDEKMNGIPMWRLATSTGWAYTLYQRTGKKPFVHALDTVHKRAFCIDLPWRDSDRWIQKVRMRVRGGMLELRRNAITIARVDRKTMEVTR